MMGSTCTELLQAPRAPPTLYLIYRGSGNPFDPASREANYKTAMRHTSRECAHAHMHIYEGIKQNGVPSTRQK